MSTLLEDLYADLQEDEGYGPKVYDDPVKPGEGLWTGGWGHLLSAAEKKQYPLGSDIPSDVAQQWRTDDIDSHLDASRRAVPGFDTAPRGIQRGVFNALYQLGPNADSVKFPKAFEHLRNGRVPAAITEFGLNNAGTGPSDWSTQTAKRFGRTMEKLQSGWDELQAQGAPPSTSTTGVAAAAPSSAGLMGQPTTPKSNIPESWLERRGDEVEMLGKSLVSGVLDTASLVARVIDGPFEATGPAADYLSEAAEGIQQSMPDWIKDDIHKQVFTRTDDGGWEFDMPSLRAIANLAVQSVGPGGAIALGGKGLAKLGAKHLPGLFKQGSRLAPAASYGVANAAYIATDSYQNVYQKALLENIRDGMGYAEAKEGAEGMAQIAAMAAGTLSLGTGTLGGLAMTAGGTIRRIAVGAGLGSATEAVEEPGQYVSEQLAQGLPVDPAEVASRAVLGALAAGPVEGAMAGLAGDGTATARAAGEALIDDAIGEVPSRTPRTPTTEIVEPVTAPTLPVLERRDDVPPPASGMEPLDLHEDFFEGLEQTVPAPGPAAVADETTVEVAPLLDQATEQVTDPATAEPNVFMDEAGNIWDQDGNPAERPEPADMTPLDTAAHEAATSPTNEMEVDMGWKGIRDQIVDAKLMSLADKKKVQRHAKKLFETGKSPVEVAEILNEKYAMVIEVDGQIVEPAAEPVGLSDESLKARAWEDVVAGAKATYPTLTDEDIDNAAANAADLQSDGSTQEDLFVASLEGIVEEKAKEATAEPELTKEEQKKLERLQAIAAAQDARRDLDDLEGPGGLMVDETEEFDPAAAMAAAAAKTAETAPADLTPEEMEAQSREVHTADVRKLNGKPLTVAMEVAGLDPTIKGKKLAQRQDELIKARVQADINRPAMSDPNADAVAAEQVAKQVEQRAEQAAKLEAAQAEYDAETKKIDGMTGIALRGMIKKLKNPDLKVAKGDKVADLKAKIHALREPRPEAAPEVESAPVEAAVPSSQPPTATPIAETSAPEQPSAPVTPPEPVEPPQTRGYVVSGKPTQIPEETIKKHWGNDWIAKVHRIQVGPLVYTVWRGTKRVESDGLYTTAKGKLGNYVAVLGEPKDFNPRQDAFNPMPTGSTRLRPGRDGSAGTDARAWVEEHANKELTRLFDQAVLEGRRKEEPTPMHDTHMAEAETIANDVFDKNASREDTIKAAMRVRELSHAVADNTKAYQRVLDQWHRIREHYDTKRDPGETAGLSEAVAEVLAKREGEIEAAKVEARRRQKAIDRDKGLKNRSARRVEREANTLPTEDDLNAFERLILENERRRGISWDTLRYLYRNWRGKQTKDDLDFEQSQGVDVIKDLKSMSLMDVIQRFRRGEVLRWTTAGIDQSVYLREVMTILKNVMPEGQWSDDMNIRDLLDAVVPKTKNRMTNFGKNQLEAYVERLKTEGVTHEDMTSFAGALHARWRNVHMVQRAEVKAESDMAKAQKEAQTALHDMEAKQLATVHVDPTTADGQAKMREATTAKSAYKAADQRRMDAEQVHRTLEPSETLSGISADMIGENLDALTPAEQDKRLAIFKDHYFVMAQAQRAEYREGQLVAPGKLNEWDVELPANMSDLLTLPTPGDPNYREDIAKGFHQTYVPLQHQKLDYNLAQVEANMRKPATVEYNDIAGDEVRTAAGQASDGVQADMPAYIWERMQENLYTAYARRELNDVYRTLAKMVRENPNALIWSNLVQTQEELDQQEANPQYDEFGTEIDEQFMPDSLLRGKDADVPGAKLRRSLGLSDLRDTEFLPIRYKDKDGRQGIIRIHSAQFEAVFNGESGLGGTPTKYAGKVSQWISKVNTAWSPGFLAAQIPKDYLSAKALLDPAISKHVTLRRYRQTYKAYRDVMMGNDAPADASKEYTEVRRVIEEEYLPSGSHTTFFNKAKMSDHYTTLQEAIAEANNTGEGSRVPDAGTPLRLLKATGKMLDMANTIVENIPRILAFQGALKEGKTLHQARFIARELNVNFASMGSRGAQINSWYPFYNATVSGNAILYRAFKNSPKFRKAVYGYAALGLTNGIAQSILAGEDDDGRSRYWNLPKHVRDRNFVFFIPGVEQPLKVPLPYGLNAAVVMGDALAEAIMNPEADIVGAVTRGTSSVMNTFNPIASSDVIRSALPAVGEPVYDLMRNKNFFGSPIMPGKTGPGAGKITDAYNVRDPDTMSASTLMAQGLAWATGGSEFAAGGIDVAPGQLEYVWDFATGSAGATVRRTFEALTAGSMQAGGVKLPMLRRYFGGVSDFHHKARYYDLREDLAGIQNQRKLLYSRRRANPERYADHKAEYKDYYDRGVMRKFDQTEKRLRKLIGDKNKIRKQYDKSEFQKRRIATLNDRIDKAVVGFNRYYFDRFIKGDM